MTTNTFSGQANTDPQGNPEAQASAAPTEGTGADQQPALIVGERAFASMEDVKTKITNADSHISTIEAENAKLRAAKEALEAELKEAKSLEDALNRTNSSKEGQTLTAEEIRNIAKETLSETQQQTLRDTNRIDCLSKAEEVYGKDFIQTIAEEAKGLNMTMEEVDSMAEKNPALFKRTFIKSEPPKKNPASFDSNVNTANFQYDPAPQEEKRVLDMTSKERAAALQRKLLAINNQ